MNVHTYGQLLIVWSIFIFVPLITLLGTFYHL